MKKFIESLSSSPRSVALTSYIFIHACLMLFYIGGKDRDGKLAVFLTVMVICMGYLVTALLLLDWQKKERARINEYASGHIKRMFEGLDGDANILDMLNAELPPLLRLIGPLDAEGEQELFRAVRTSCPQPFMEKLFDMMIMKYPNAWSGKSGKDLAGMLAQN